MEKILEQIKSVNTQSAPTKNQIKSNKPDIFKNANVLQGTIANSVNGGFIKLVGYTPVMAGTKILDYKIRLNLGTLTPKTPQFQQLKAVLKTYFVPNKRVWANAENFTAQKDTPTETRITEEPNIGGQVHRTMPTTENQYNYLDTDLFRDSYANGYLPRYQQGYIRSIDEIADTVPFPKYSILPLRGFKAIINDFERNKEYDEKLQEYFGDTVTQQEFDSIMPMALGTPYSKCMIRGKRQNSYYTDYRTQLLGQEIEIPNLNETNKTMSSLTEWQKKLAEARSEAENAQLNDWDIIAKIRGSKKLSEGKVQLLGMKEIPLNFNIVAQDTYNINENISEDFQTLGQLGAYSYTEIDVSMVQMQEIIEEGYIHTLIQITSDSVFETAFDRLGLNVNALDKYRPDLKDLKDDYLYEIEKCGTRINSEEDLTKITGFKRKFSEYFKLPNAIGGDLTTFGYYQTKANNTEDTITSFNIEENENNLPILLQSKRTFQMFETDDKETGRFEPKKIWKDYTDIEFNRNLAIMHETEEIKDDDGITIELRVKGENQFYFVGRQTLIADLPIDENIKNNFTKWGEL